MQSAYKNNKGSALAIVLSVGTLVTLLVFTWVTFSLHNSATTKKEEMSINARYAAESAISNAIYELNVNLDSLKKLKDTIKVLDTAFSDNSILEYNDTIRNCNASAVIDNESPFLKIISTGNCKTQTHKIEAQFGRDMSTTFMYALILTDNRPLVLKNSKITGDVVLNAKPIGNINGKIVLGKATLPKVETSVFYSAMTKMEQKLLSPDSSDSVFHSSKTFTNSAQLPQDSQSVIYVDGNVLIEGGTNSVKWRINKPITIVSTGDIQISGNVILENVKLIAQGQIKCFDNSELINVTMFTKSTAYFGDQARFSGIIYTYEEVLLVNQAVIEQPSVVFSRGQKTDKKRIFTGLYLAQESRFNGTFVCINAASLSGIEKDAVFNGLFITYGNLILNGSVNGCVCATSLKSSSEDNSNVIVDGRINRKNLAPNFVIPVAFGNENDAYKVVKWIYE